MTRHVRVRRAAPRVRSPGAGGMFLPGYLKEVAGTYTASLLMSLVATTLTFFCFVVMYVEHPIGAPPPPKKKSTDLV